MTTQTAPPVPADTDDALVGRLIRFLETLDGGDEVFAPDTRFDVNVPQWRMQYGGLAPFVAWLREHAATGYPLLSHSSIATADGFAIEFDSEYDHLQGERFYFRNLWLCAVDGDRITDVVMYCTGDWDAETRRRHAAQAPMLTGRAS